MTDRPRMFPRADPGVRRQLLGDLRRVGPAGLALGVALAVLAGATGYPDGLQTLYDFVLIFGVLFVLALVFRGTLFLLQWSIEIKIPRERRKPVTTEDLIFARYPLAVTFAAAAACLPIAIGNRLGNGSWTNGSWTIG